MFDALFSLIFDLVLNAVGTAIAKLFGVADAAEVASVVIGLGFIAIGIAMAISGH